MPAGLPEPRRTGRAARRSRGRGPQESGPRPAMRVAVGPTSGVRTATQPPILHKIANPPPAEERTMIDVLEPSTEQVLDRVAETTSGELETVSGNAGRAQQAWRRASPQDRA